MTAPVTMLTDEVIEKAAIRHSDKEHSPFNSDARYHFKAGARFARARHKARLAEDAKVRAQLVATLESIATVSWRNFDAELQDPQSFVDWAKSIANAALAAAKERA